MVKVFLPSTSGTRNVSLGFRVSGRNEGRLTASSATLNVGNTVGFPTVLRHAQDASGPSLTAKSAYEDFIMLSFVNKLTRKRRKHEMTKNDRSYDFGTTPAQPERRCHCRGFLKRSSVRAFSLKTGYFLRAQIFDAFNHHQNL